MSVRVATPLLVGLGLAYLLVFGWAVLNTSYDSWGALVAVPVLFALGTWIVRRMFTGELASLVPILVVGIALKFAGAYARYWVGFDAYRGAIDAGRYHEYAVQKLGPIYAGDLHVVNLWPRGTGTPFMEETTALIFAVTGTSLIGGFMVFAWLAYLGTLWFVKAACLTVPGLAARKYAVLVVLAPSIVYWPASIGKEAWMFLMLGLATYGFARILVHRGLLVPIAMGIVGLVGAGMVRPHMAGLFVAGAIPAAIVALFVRVRSGTGRRRASDTLAILGVIVIAVIGLAVAVGATTRYLNFTDDEGGVTTTSIIEETQRRTEQAGSVFEPPSIDNPANWPYASIRTLTRPLPHEASGLAQLISAAEMTLLIGIALVSWRRLANLPRLVLRVPYVAFAVSIVFFGSLAMTSFANLGVLTRQRTILFPLLLLLLAVPTRREDLDRQELEEEAAEMERLRAEVAGTVEPAPRSSPIPAGWRAGRVAVPASVPTGGGGAPTPAGWVSTSTSPASQRVEADGGWVAGVWAPPTRSVTDETQASSGETRPHAAGWQSSSPAPARYESPTPAAGWSTSARRSPRPDDDGLWPSP